MNETTAKFSGTNNYFCEDVQTSSKKIGQTIYMSTYSFNGDKNWDMVAALTRLIEQDTALVTSEA